MSSGSKYLVLVGGVVALKFQLKSKATAEQSFIERNHKVDFQGTLKDFSGYWPLKSARLFPKSGPTWLTNPVVNTSRANESSSKLATTTDLLLMPS